jgi:hypothetical protein
MSQFDDENSVNSIISQSGSLNLDDEFIPNETNPESLLDINDEISKSVQSSVQTSINNSKVASQNLESQKLDSYQEEEEEMSGKKRASDLTAEETKMGEAEKRQTITSISESNLGEVYYPEGEEKFIMSYDAVYNSIVNDLFTNERINSIVNAGTELTNVVTKSLIFLTRPVTILSAAALAAAGVFNINNDANSYINLVTAVLTYGIEQILSYATFNIDSVLEYVKLLDYKFILNNIKKTIENRQIESLVEQQKISQIINQRLTESKVKLIDILKQRVQELTIANETDDRIIQLNNVIEKLINKEVPTTEDIQQALGTNASSRSVLGGRRKTHKKSSKSKKSKKNHKKQHKKTAHKKRGSRRK